MSIVARGSKEYVPIKKAVYTSKLVDYDGDIFFQYEVACKILRGHGVNTREKWEEYKSRNNTLGIPRDPQTVYGSKFSWTTWLG